MNAGAAAARGRSSCSCTADTVLPPLGMAGVLEAMSDGDIVGGAFRVRLVPSPSAGAYTRAALGITGRAIGLRSLLTRSYTGDQAMFVRAAAFRVWGASRTSRSWKTWRCRGG